MKKTEQNRSLTENIGHTQRLETLGVLASGIAHDFNNLLVTILGNADLALLKLESDSRLYDLVHHIKMAALRASGLTNQMLAYSGKGSFLLEPVDLNVLVDEMAHLLKVSISKNITLKFSFTENLPAVKADAAQIRQIIMNLITNASEAIGQTHGTIAIKTGITVQNDTPNETNTSGTNEYVYIEITDTGCGIDDALKETIFDPFFTTKPTGRGLGLSVVKENIRGHNGIISIDSNSQCGTTITVSFPSTGKPIEIKEIEEITTDSYFPKGKTIFIIEDETDVLEVTKSMLETEKFSIYAASNGHEGIELFNMHAPEIDIVLLDVTMPGMSGEEIFHSLRNIRPDIPVILSSGFSQQYVSEIFKDQPMTEFIQKPYQIKTLVKKIAKTLKCI